MNDQKLIMRCKYEKYVMPLAWQQVEGTNKSSKAHECKKHRTIYNA